MYTSLADSLQRQDCIAILRYAPEEGCLQPQQHARRVSPNATRARLVRSTWTPNAVQLQHQTWAIHVPLRLTAESGPLQRRLSPSAFRGPARKQSAAANHPVHPPRCTELSSPLVATRRHWDRNTGLGRSEHRTWILQVQIDSLLDGPLTSATASVCRGEEQNHGAGIGVPHWVIWVHDLAYLRSRSY